MINQFKQKSTLKQSVLSSFLRQFSSFFSKALCVLCPFNICKNQKQLANFDLWGPAVFLLINTILLNLSGNFQNVGTIIGQLMTIMLVSSIIIFLNSKLLQINIDFLQCICVLGYAALPLSFAFIAIMILKEIGVTEVWVKILCGLVGLSWSVLSSLRFMEAHTIKDRAGLAIYPIVLYFIGLSWYMLFA